MGRPGRPGEFGAPLLRLLLRSLLPAALLAATILPAVLLPPPARAEGIDFYARVLLNRQEKGEMLVRRDEGGRFLVREEDWPSLGLTPPRTVVAGADGERLVPVDGAGGGLAASFDEATVTLEITARPELFPLRVKSLGPTRRQDVLRPDDDSAFLNYGVTWTGGSAPETTAFPNEVGVRRRGFLFLNGGSLESGDGGTRYRRYGTSVTRDDRERLTRIVLGDAPATSGELGSSFSLAGVTYRKEYRIDPYLHFSPTAGLRGETLYPAELTVYVDNVQVASERIPPGPFELRDFAYYGGAGEMRFVLKDAFGREEEVRNPYYFTDAVLKEGFQDFSFQAGLLRKAGAEGDEGYSDPAFSFHHRRGLSDELTFGVRGEGASSRFNGGVTASRKVGVVGVLAAAVAAGTDGEGGAGVAGYASYSYQDRRASFRATLEGRSEGYGTAADPAGTGTKVRAAVGGGYTAPGVGSVSADFFTVSRYGEEGQSVFSLTLLRTVGRRLDLQGGYRYTDGTGDESEFFLFATYRLGTDCTASLRAAAGDGGSREEAELRRNVPLGEGYGYSVRLAREDRDGSDSTLFLPSGRYNGRVGVLAGDVESRSGEGSGTAYRLGAAGSVLQVGDELLLSRPVYDSFGVATGGGVPGVTVYQNGQPIGATDERGRVVLPNLNSYYENQVALDDKAIPIEYSVREVTRYVSPPYRSGSLVPFDVTRLQAITGYLDIMVDGRAVPAEYAEATIEGVKEPVPTGKGGEFYLENLPPGEHAGTARVGHRSCRFRLSVPDTKEFIVELGRIACEPAP